MVSGEHKTLKKFVESSFEFLNFFVYILHKISFLETQYMEDISCMHENNSCFAVIAYLLQN